MISYEDEKKLNWKYFTDTTQQITLVQCSVNVSATLGADNVTSPAACADPSYLKWKSEETDKYGSRTSIHISPKECFRQEMNKE